MGGDIGDGDHRPPSRGASSVVRGTASTRSDRNISGRRQAVNGTASIRDFGPGPRGACGTGGARRRGACARAPACRPPARRPATDSRTKPAAGRPWRRSGGRGGARRRCGSPRHGRARTRVSPRVLSPESVALATDSADKTSDQDARGAHQPASGPAGNRRRRHDHHGRDSATRVSPRVLSPESVALATDSADKTSTGTPVTHINPAGGPAGSLEARDTTITAETAPHACRPRVLSPESVALATDSGDKTSDRDASGAHQPGGPRRPAGGDGAAATARRSGAGGSGRRGPAGRASRRR